jgi:putative membrane protein
MMWNGDGSWGVVAVALPFVILCIAMMWMMGHGHGSHGHGEHNTRVGASAGRRSGGPERILAERLARGEIDIDEYDHRLAALRGASEPDRAEEVRHGA